MSGIDQNSFPISKIKMLNMPTVLHCAREQLKGAARYGPVIRRVFVVECNLTGYGSVIINGREHPFGPGQCYVLFPGDTVTQVSDGAAPRGGIYCIIDAPELALHFKKAGISSENPFISQLLSQKVQNWVEKMLVDFGCRDASAPMRQASNIYGLLGTLLENTPADSGIDAVTKAIGLMEANYPDPMSIKLLAQAVGLERTYFSCLFKEKTGYSPYQYLTALRIQKACLLLKETDLSIATIAELVGLDARNFARLFKKEMRRTPLAYRQKQHLQ